MTDSILTQFNLDIKLTGHQCHLTAAALTMAAMEYDVSELQANLLMAMADTYTTQAKLAFIDQLTSNHDKKIEIDLDELECEIQASLAILPDPMRRQLLRLPPKPLLASEEDKHNN